MTLHPKKMKFKKFHQKCFKIKENKNLLLSRANYGFKSLQNKELSAEQLECLRKSITKKNNKFDRVWFNVFPHFGKSKKPVELRMGKGKGSIEYWFCFIKTGRIIFEFDNADNRFIDNVKNCVVKKLPFKTKLVFKKI